jgi:hypothetical protein
MILPPVVELDHKSNAHAEMTPEYADPLLIGE